MSLNVPARPEPPPVSAVAAAVVGDLTMALRRASMVAASHEIDGCPTPGRCRPCAGEARRRQAVELAEYRRADRAARAEAVAQHVVSAARLAERRQARDAARIAATERLAPGAACVVCRSSSSSGRSCRSCGGATAATAPPRMGQDRPRADGRGVEASGAHRRSEAMSPSTNPIGFAHALREMAHAEEANRCLG